MSSRSIEQRLEAVEAALASLVPSEALEPNYLTQDSLGRVGAKFSGHVSAQGIDLSEAVFAAPPGLVQPGPTTAVDWLDTAAAVRQFLQGQRWNWNVGLNAHVQDELDLGVDDTGGDLKALLTLFHHLSAGAGIDSAGVSVRARNGAGTKDVTRSILTSDGTSDFWQAMTAIAAVNKAAPGNGNVAWTTLDVSAQVPAPAKYAVLRVAVGGVVINSAAYLANSIDLRMDAASQIAASVAFKLANPTASGIGGGVTETVIVPLTAAHTFQYQKNDGINSSSGGAIEIVGYIT